MEELRGFIPTRRSLVFSPLEEDPSGEFYELHFSNLFMDIYSIVERAFCAGNEGARSQMSPWLRPYPPEFIAYAQQVARPGMPAGHWAKLIRDKSERSCLLQAIIFRIIHVKVMSSLLFGADLEYAQRLHVEDKASLSTEGLRRSRTRACANRTYLQSFNGKPPLFWWEVDEIALQVVALLEPMFIYTTGLSDIRASVFNMHTLYQWVHDLVAYAGWLNVCISQSSAILVSNWPEPGDRLDIGQVNLSQEIYESSEVAMKEMVSRSEELCSDKRHDKLVARIKICVAPELVRISPETSALGYKGMATYQVMKPHVVYYQGFENEAREREHHLSLLDYIRLVRNRNCVPHAAALAIMLLGVCWWSRAGLEG